MTMEELALPKNLEGLTGLNINCAGKQLPRMLPQLDSLQVDSAQLSNSQLGSPQQFTHLSFSDFPAGCRVCVYQLFRDIKLNGFTSLLEFSVVRHYVDDFAVSLDHIIFPRSLQKLVLQGLGLLTVPSSVYELDNLLELSLANNLLFSIADLTRAPALRSVKSLDVSLNRLSLIPPTIGFMENLQNLNISKNCIKEELPQTIRLLVNLTHLDLSWNRITGIPDNTLVTTQLHEADLSHNKLTHVPASLVNHPAVILDDNINLISPE